MFKIIKNCTLLLVFTAPFMTAATDASIALQALMWWSKRTMPLDLRFLDEVTIAESDQEITTKAALLHGNGLRQSQDMNRWFRLWSQSNNPSERKGYESKIVHSANEWNKDYKEFTDYLWKYRLKNALIKCAAVGAGTLLLYHQRH